MRAVANDSNSGDSIPPIVGTLKRKAAELLGLLRSAEAYQPEGGWDAYVEAISDLVVVLDGGKHPLAKPNAKAWQQFGKLLRDKRNAVGYSRSALAKRARLSDATIKFIETAYTRPSRGSLIRLIGVPELNLTWDQVPGRSPAPLTSEPAPEPQARAEELNCYLATSEDPTSKVMTFGKFLQGAGGHVEQTNAYLDHQSAAAYMAMCQHSPVAATLRASLPLNVVAEEIVRRTHGGLNFLALGSGDGSLEVRLVQHLISQAPPNYRVELHLLDVSQPLLSAAYKHAVDVLGGAESVIVTAMQCNFHHLPLYTQLHYSPKVRRPRLFCLLGGTLANLDNEPRFFQHSLVGSEGGDLLLVDFQLARAASSDPEAIKRRDRSWGSGVSAAHAEWLSGPIWRHCKDVLSVEFHWNLETQCPMAGSYALEAIATVQQKNRPDRQFCMFQFRRYDPRCVEECLKRLGWELIKEAPYGPVDGRATLMLYRKQGGAG